MSPHPSSSGGGAATGAGAPAPAVVVLAAGRGSRLADAGADVPKWLLPVDGRPLAHFHLEALAADRSAWSRLVVVTGHRSDTVEAERLSALAGRTCELVHNVDYATRNNWLSLAHALDHLETSGWRGAVCVLNSDLLLPPTRLQAFLRAAPASRGTSLLVTDTTRELSDEAMKVVADEDGAIVDIGKGELRGHAAGEFVGLSAIAAEHVGPLRRILAGFEREPERHDEWYEGAYRRAIDAGVRFAVFQLGSADWVEIDDERDLRLARELAGRYDA